MIRVSGHGIGGFRFHFQGIVRAFFVGEHFFIFRLHYQFGSLSLPYNGPFSVFAFFGQALVFSYLFGSVFFYSLLFFRSFFKQRTTGSAVYQTGMIKELELTARLP